MLINKITTGFVIQVFDTEKGRFVSQSFTAGDQCDYEDKDGEPVDSKQLEMDGNEACLPFDMVQPKADSTAVAERLADKADAAGLTPEDLDETVHELAAELRRRREQRRGGGATRLSRRGASVPSTRSGNSTSRSRSMRSDRRKGNSRTKGEIGQAV